MSETFLILRPYGSGYSVVPTERNDSPIRRERFTIGVHPGAIVFDTGMPHTEYSACLAGWSFDTPVYPLDLYLEKNLTSGMWDIVGTASGATGAGAFVDVIFLSHGICAPLD